MDSLDTISQKSHAIVLDLLPDVDAEELSEQSDLFDLGLDSINAMTLVMNLQSEFGVEFDMDDINLDNFRTVSDIANLIQRKSAQTV